ncbi:hypothetical protein Ari01nite_92590 [Paractinoplanes rishiriensis]|uniref:Uncharacterized protein n=1 Tax=Paractinoplanes rishiriensis TaxID=1050105 RepID=A0A919KAL8_9ACTN|nr:hypothetical protein Ari01nite_92590 [Actinoplanes rishiriensis]
MDTQHFTNEVPICPCGAQLGTGHPTLCRKCVARVRWNRRHQARGGHGGADRAVRTRSTRRNGRRDGGCA